MPELTLLCDGLPSSAAHRRRDSSVKNICGSSEQMLSTASSNIEAVISNVSDSVNSMQIQSSNVTRPTAGQLPLVMEFYQPVMATNVSEENSMSPCCHRCTNCQTTSDERNTHFTDKCGGNGKRSYDAAYARDNCVQCSTSASVSVQSSVVPDVMLNSMSSPPNVCVGSMRIPIVSISSATKVSVPEQPLTASDLAVQPPAACGGSRHLVESVRLPTSTMSTSSSPAAHSGQPLTSGLRQNGQLRHCSLPCGPRFVQASHQKHSPHEVQHSAASCNHTGCHCQGSLQISQHPAVPTRFLSPASSQHAMHAGVRQPCQISPAQGSCLPSKVKCKSRDTADQLDGRCYVSPPAAAKAMQCTQLQHPSSMVRVASQHGELRGSLKAICCPSKRGSPVMGPGPWCSVPVCQQGVLYDSGRCASQSSSALMSDSECQVDIQHTCSHSLTPAVSTATTSRPRTVNDLLQTVHVQNVDRPVVSSKDFVTVDDFVESVLGRHSSPSADSGLQVNDSADSGNTPQLTSSSFVAVDNCNNVLHNADASVACSEDGSSQWSVNMKKCRKVGVRSDTSGEHLGYFQDATVAKTAEHFSPGDNRPKLCSVAVNTSFYWPPADSGSSRNNDNTAQAVIDMAVRHNGGYARDVDSPGTDVLRILRDSDRYTEVVTDTCDSTDDISLRTPPPPVFPSPTEESVVSEMIMDMPEYSALSQEK